MIGGCPESQIAIENKNHKHRYINVSKTFMGASISRKNDLLETPPFLLVIRLVEVFLRVEAKTNDEFLR